MLIPILAVTLSGYTPPISEAVIYEANLRAEGPTGGFTALTKRLGSIKKLGANVLWLMPVQPVGKLRSAGGLGSPYATADYDAVNPEFGTAADLQHLIEEAHRLKMAVILDWVPNHTAWDHPWIKTHPDWYTHDAKGQITIPAGTNWQDVADLNYDQAPLRAAMIASMRGWIKRFGIDGFRCDTADWVPFEFWREAIPKLRASTPRPLLMLAEGFRADHYKAGFDLTYGWQFYDRMVAIYKGAKATELAHAAANEAKNIPLGARRLRFVTNHDKDAWEGTPLDFFHTPQGVFTASVVTAFYGGTPLIYTGQEVNWPQRIPLFDRSTVDWQSNPEVGRQLSALFALRRAHPALRTGTTTDFSTSDLIAFVRKQGLDEVLVVANVRNRQARIEFPSAYRGSWKDGPSLIDLPASVTVAPYDCLVLVRPQR